MEQYPGLQQGFRIGDLEVHPLDNQLRRGRRNLDVSPQAMEMLLELACHPREIVPRIALQRSLQTDADSLGRCWAELWRAVGELGEASQHLRQVGTEGYQLTADVLIDSPPVPTSEQIV